MSLWIYDPFRLRSKVCNMGDTSDLKMLVNNDINLEDFTKVTLHTSNYKLATK